MASEIALKIEDTDVRALFEKPPGAGPHPALVVTYHMGGLDEFTHWLVEDLAREGFMAIAPDHYHWLPSMDEIDNRKKYLLDSRLALDLAVARSYLEMQDDFAGPGVGILGHCMGGRTTLLGACTDKRYKAACIWYGGGSFQAQGPGPAPTEQVDRIAAKVMGFFGNDDKNPSPEDVDKLDAIMTKAGVWHEFHRYDNAGHAFMNPWGKSYAEKPAKESWPRALAFLRAELAP